MKKIIVILMVVIISFWCIPRFIGMIWAGKSDKKKGKQEQVVKDKRGHKYKVDKQGRYHRVYRKENHPYHHKRDRAYSRYNRPHNNRWKNHRYNGHYRWHEWRQERERPRYRGGQYHHDDNGFLMFSFCDQQGRDKTCFSISID